MPNTAAASAWLRPTTARSRTTSFFGLRKGSQGPLDLTGPVLGCPRVR